ncbi:PAS domain-containing protein [Desertibaculum subflavum]|uniref:PAS domain-containing protein n=1 Tax=Desertibaculum subflavum TaxID=2268458 RepID=UPI000E6723AF
MGLDELLSGLRQADSVIFVEAWRRWRGGGLLPRRADMDLRDIRRCLMHVMLCEVRGPDEVLVRVSGSRIADSLDFELTGNNYKDRTDPTDWPERSRHFIEMTARPCGGFMQFRDEVRPGRVNAFETVSLPLEADEPARPRLVLSLNTPLDRDFERHGRAGGSVVAALDFIYVDIGAGVPN